MGNNTGLEIRRSEADLWRQAGVRKYRKAVRCPGCGHKAFLRRPADQRCYECVCEKEKTDQRAALAR